MWTRLYTGAFLAPSQGDNGHDLISPFSFQVLAANRLLFEADSQTAKPGWWKAGWVNFIRIDANFPTFEAIESWERLPLGKSIFTLPSRALYQVRIEPVYYLRDFAFKAWVEYL